MTTHSTIRKVLRTLVSSFFAACLLAVWPLSAEAGNHTTRVQGHDMNITKSSPVMAKTKPNGNERGNVAAKSANFGRVQLDWHRQKADGTTKY